MESKKDALPEDEDSETDTQDNDDLLYKHKPEARGSEMRWNTTLCRKSGR